MQIQCNRHKLSLLNDLSVFQHVCVCRLLDYHKGKSDVIFNSKTDIAET